MATCPSIPAARFAFCLSLFVLFLLFVVVLFGEPKQNQGRGLVDRKLVCGHVLLFLFDTKIENRKWDWIGSVPENFLTYV